MKATIRIPTEQYAFIEIETEVESPADAIFQYREMAKLYKGGTGLVDKEYNRILDAYIWGNQGMHPEEWEGMNEDQQIIIQAIKRSRKRWNYKKEPLNETDVWQNTQKQEQDHGPKEPTSKAEPKRKSSTKLREPKASSKTTKETSSFKT